MSTNYTNISHYAGDYTTGVAYEKFDFVFNKSDGIYYYAKDDIKEQDNAVNPSLDSANWSSDTFFFDADYGSSVNFKCQNIKSEYSDGYYIYQPVGINCVRMEANLQFKNRSNKEANAIMHFVESHLGQYEKDRPSPNLRYSQGINGFSWGGESSFHPYDSTEINSKKFYCLEYSHSLNFENSNDVNVKLSNFDTSLLNKSEALYIDAATTYDENTYYEKNDIVLFADNHKYYYCVSDNPINNLAPSAPREVWDRDGGYFQDQNKDVWTRDFLWKPSLTIKIDQAPRLKKINLAADYNQIYRDGINEKLLKLNLQFNNRSDDEAQAILHFLEQHYGCVPFVFNAPAPYEKQRNFVCQEWNHVYNYKNNHSITVTFEEFPFALPAEKYDGLVTEPTLRGSELVVPEYILIEDLFAVTGFGRSFRQRVFFKNTGDSDLTIDSIRIERGNFSIVGQRFSTECVMIVDKHEDNDYIVTLPIDANLPFGLSGKDIKIFKQYSPGVSGGITFSSVYRNQQGKYIREMQNGRANSYIQSNTGLIMNLVTSEVSGSYDDFIDYEFFQANKKSILKPGETGFVDVYYNGTIGAEDFNEPIQGLDFLTSTGKSRYFGGRLEFVVNHSDGSQEVLNSGLRINLTN